MKTDSLIVFRQKAIFFASFLQTSIDQCKSVFKLLLLLWMYNHTLFLYSKLHIWKSVIVLYNLRYMTNFVLNWKSCISPTVFTWFKTKPVTAPTTGRKVFSNHRERFRQQNVSGAFGELRRLLPTHPVDKKLSKSEILKLSIKYIKLLQGVLKWQEENASET